MPRGQKTEILTRELIKQVEENLSLLLYLETIPAIIGVNKSTFYAWLRTGARANRKAAKTGKAIPKNEILYAELSNSVKKGLALGQRVAMLKIASAKEWQSAAWMLERRYPDKWGKDTEIVKQFREIIKNVQQTAPPVVPVQQLPKPNGKPRNKVIE